MDIVRAWQEHRLAMVLAGVSLISGVLALVSFIVSFRMVEPIQIVTGVSGGSLSPMQVYVDIEGEVVRPGVYTVNGDARVGDVLEQAGGLSQDADVELVSKQINRAARVSDGMKIFIPARGDSPQSAYSSASELVSAGSVAGAVAISINTAGMTELESLPGIGEKTAQKIIDARPYSSLEELVTRKIIYQSTFDKIHQQISL